MRLAPAARSGSNAHSRLHRGFVQQILAGRSLGSPVVSVEHLRGFIRIGSCSLAMSAASHFEHLHPRRVAAYDRVRQVLRRWDPIGVVCDENQDEYDSYAQEFASRLDAEAPVDEIVEFMRTLVRDHMGMSSFDEARARACATELAVFWRSWKDG
jgi:hypothetical protein